jgi:site-specific DNA recombinase
MRYILYARKSSESEDRQVQSIDDQVSALREGARRSGINVVDELTEARSAKDPGNRPVFASMLEQIEAGAADGIYCWSINRLSRNPIDSGRLTWLLQKGVLKSIRTIDREYLPEDNVLLMAVESGVANQYIIDLRKAVIRGMEGKARRGWYPAKPPQGYCNDPVTREIEPLEPQFGMLRRAWELLLSGAYNVPQVRAELAKWGYVCPGRGVLFSESNLYRIFDNPFYHGTFRYRGSLYHGKHMPMVTKAEFDLVQRTIHGETQIQPRRHEFPFTGLMRCGYCGCMVTAERKVKHYTGTGRTVAYEYYRCTRRRGKCPEPAVTGDYIEDELAKKLDQLAIDSDFAEWLVGVIERDIGAQDATDRAVAESQASVISSINERLDRLLDMRLSGELSEEEFRRHRSRYQEEVAHRAAEVMRIQFQQDALKMVVRFGVVANKRFRDDDMKLKRQIAKTLGVRYVLTHGKLKISVHPALLAISKLEPPKPPSNMGGGEVPNPRTPVMCSRRSPTRTLLSGLHKLILTDLSSFSRLGELIGLGEAA